MCVYSLTYICIGIYCIYQRRATLKTLESGTKMKTITKTLRDCGYEFNYEATYSQEDFDKNMAYRLASGGRYGTDVESVEKYVAESAYDVIHEYTIAEFGKTAEQARSARPGAFSTNGIPQCSFASRCDPEGKLKLTGAEAEIVKMWAQSF